LHVHVHREGTESAPRNVYRECRQKAWGAACHASWIGDQLDKLIEDYAKLKRDDEALEGEIKTLETALDYHTSKIAANAKHYRSAATYSPSKWKQPAPRCKTVNAPSTSFTRASKPTCS
jgi:hypothetical protein